MSADRALSTLPFVLLTLLALHACGGGSTPEPVASAPTPTTPPVVPPVTIASDEHSLIFSDDFATTPFVPLNRGTGPFLLRFGQDVIPNVGLLLIKQNVTDTYARIESTRFWPAQKAEVKLTHRMDPSLSWPNYYFPSVNFKFRNGSGASFSWLRSAWAPDYCSSQSNYDKVLVRHSPSNCIVSNIKSSSLYGVEITSTIILDVNAGKLKYVATTSELNGSPIEIARADLDIPITALDPIVSVDINGYGWYTGHEHQVRKLEVTTTPLGNAPAIPIRRTANERSTAGLLTVALAPTVQAIDNFAKRWYWEDADTDGKRKNHIGSDIAMSNGGLTTVKSATAGRAVVSLCDTGEVIDLIDSGDATTHVALIRYSNCGGRAVNIYYGHMTPTVAKGTVVKRNQDIGTVANWGSNSHLHLTIDPDTGRNLLATKYYRCAVALNAARSITNFSGCSSTTSTDRATAGEALVRVGWGKLTILSHRAQGETAPVEEDLYVDPAAFAAPSDVALRFIPLAALLN